MSIDAKWVIGICLALETLFLGSTFETSAVTAAVAAIVFMLVWVRLNRAVAADERANRRRVRWVTWILRATVFIAIVGMTTAWRVQGYVVEGVNPMVVVVDVVAHTCLFAGWAVWFQHPRSGHVSLLPLGLVVVLLCVAAGGASHSLAGQTTVALAACIGFVLASQAILSVDRTARQVVNRRTSEATSGGRLRVATLFSLLALSAILMSTSGIATATSAALPSIQNLLHAKLKSSFESVVSETSIGGTRYVRGNKLGSIRRHLLGDPTSVALRLYSDSPPGYLRGHAFDLYNDRRWFSASRVELQNQVAAEETANRYIVPSGPGSTNVSVNLRRQLGRFPIHADAQPATMTIETYNDPIKGPLVFTPLGTRWLEASSRQLTVSHNGIIETGVDVTRPYVAGVASIAPRERLTGERRKILLWVNPELEQTAQTLATRLCRDRTTARGKAEAISDHFQKNYQYSLSGLAVPQRVDPIAFFLDTEHPAHCEYFASATAMLLRSSGVPARYVTGYVATEKSEDKEYWIARNRDAHAWVEAYDDATERWFPVESTPGRIYQTLDFANANLNQEDLLGGGAEDDDRGARSWLDRAWGWVMSMRATDPLIILFRIAQLPLFCLLVFLLWKRFGRSSTGDDNPIDAESRRMLRQVDRRMRRQSLVRVPHETLHQFALRVEHRSTAEHVSDKRKVLVDAATWYRQYADARYRGRLPLAFQQVSEHGLATGER